MNRRLDSFLFTDTCYQSYWFQRQDFSQNAMAHGPVALKPSNHPRFSGLAPIYECSILQVNTATNAETNNCYCHT